MVKKGAKKAARKPAVKMANARPSAARPVSQAQRQTKSMAIAALIINIFIPGLGTLIGGDRKTGLIQLIILLIAILFRLIGLIPLNVIAYVAVWIWALIVSIKMLRA